MLESILNLLADGKVHSEKEISKLLGIPCMMIPTILEEIPNASINLEVINNKNYRILGGLELLNAAYIAKKIGVTKLLLSKLEVLRLVDSTNNYLLNQTKCIGNYAVFAEQQTAGRGQFKRTWYSNFGKNIALSLLWQFSIPMNKLTGLTLTVGVAVIKALEEYGLKGIQLKWPNDIIHQGKKLAGILIESRSIEQKIKKMVIGIGLNLYVPVTPSFINDQITSIFSLQKLTPQRNQLAGLILKNLLLTLVDFEAKGLNFFIEDIQRLDNLSGKLITVQNQNNFLEGIGRGINMQGQLCVQINNKTYCFNSGEIRVKLKSVLFDS
ncbi:MAG: biotin--[acetyl-CoA-carboxylase] ligase [Gammaproteobacteria bacterium]|nr:MAG: biotin--[acetyl-CoA-carboxylase] ligase [Gammaproteobacteria bacterium]